MDSAFLNYMRLLVQLIAKLLPTSSPRERRPDGELCPAATTAAGAVFVAAAAAAAQQELGRIRRRLGRRRRRRDGAATAERQGKDHHGAHPRQRE